MTAHGKTRVYLYRFKIIGSPECPCANGTQTVGHILYDCVKQSYEREKLIAAISKEYNWPVKKCVGEQIP